MSIQSFLTLSDKLKLSWNPLSGIIELRLRSKKVRLKIGASFYIANGNQYSLNSSPILFKGKIHLPKDSVEELMSEFHLKYNYSFTYQKLIVKKRHTTRKEFSYKQHINKIDFVIIDAGHGGHDPGASGKYSSKEKTITLKAARFLFKYLKKKMPSTKIYITRLHDKFISLERRSKIANRRIRRNNLGVFISLHCNATLSRRVHGFEIYYLAQNASNAEARRVMVRENRLSRGSSYIKKLESYLLNSQIQIESKTLARVFNKSLSRKLRKLISSRGVRRADFAVLRGSLMPSVLIEMGYLTNANEARILKSNKFYQILAESIFNGLVKFNKKVKNL